MRILLVEDDQALAEALRDAFLGAEIACDITPLAQAAEEFLENYTFDAVILDLSLPDDDGLNLLRRMRMGGNGTPVIILTAQSQPTARVTGLEEGADDYLGKPFLFAELRARLNAVLRRTEGRPQSTTTIGNFTFDFEMGIATVDDLLLDLTSRERAILEVLLRRRNRIASRKILEDLLFGSSEILGSNAVEVYVHRLRRKLAAAGTAVAIETIRGVGYVLRHNP
jgi:two-component system response regulator TctD